MTVDRKVPVALQLYSVRENCKADFVKTLEDVAGAGYDGVEFAGYYEKDAKELKRILSGLNLKTAGSHLGLQFLQDDVIGGTIDYNLELGNDRIIIPHISKDLISTVDDCKKVADTFTGIHKKISAAGLSLGFHNHKIEFDDVGGQTAFDIIFKNTPDDFIMQIDIGWATVAGQEPEKIIKKYSGRANTVHVKEYSPEDEAAWVGKGIIDWKSILSVCKEQGNTEWFIVEQEKFSIPAIESVTNSLNYLKELSI